MKTYLLTVWLLYSPLLLFAQIISMKSAGADSMMVHLDQVYSSAVDVHFAADPIGVIEYWNKSVDQLHGLQKDLNVSWAHDMPCFLKFYFNKRGHIDYIFYDIKESSEVDIKRIEVLLKAYTISHVAELSGTRPFSQAGQLMFFKEPNNFSSAY